MKTAPLLLALLPGSLVMVGCGACCAEEPASVAIGEKVRLDVEVEVNGEVVFAPRILFFAGEEAEVSSGEEGRDPMVVHVDEGVMMRVTAPIYAEDGSLAGKPDITMKPGEDSSVSFSVDDDEYTVVIRSTTHTVDGVDAG